MRTKPWAAAALAVPMALAFASPAAADEETVVVLETIGGGEGEGTAELSFDEEERTLDVRVDAEGLDPDVPFAQFLAVGGEGICPPEAVESGADAEPFVGVPILALTTEGDVTPELVVDVDRVPVVTADGELAFQRTFDVAEVDPFELQDLVLVGYGVADPDVPLDEVPPVLCGAVEDVSTTPTQAGGTTAEPTPTEEGDAAEAPTEEGDAVEAPTGPTDSGGTPAPAPAPSGGQVERTPVGGVPAGAGSTNGVEHGALFALGGASLVGAGALALQRRRSVSSS